MGNDRGDSTGCGAGRSVGGITNVISELLMDTYDWIGVFCALVLFGVLLMAYEGVI
jgi:hypothetical protein